MEQGEAHIPSAKACKHEGGVFLLRLHLNLPLLLVPLESLVVRPVETAELPQMPLRSRWWWGEMRFHQDISKQSFQPSPAEAKFQGQGRHVGSLDGMLCSGICIGRSETNMYFSPALKMDEIPTKLVRVPTMFSHGQRRKNTGKWSIHRRPTMYIRCPRLQHSRESTGFLGLRVDKGRRSRCCG